VLLPEQKEKGYGVFSHFVQSIANVKAGWRLSFSAGAEASPHHCLHSPAGAKASPSAAEWIALNDLCLGQVTELQLSPHVG